MTLQVPFEQFPSTVQRLLGVREAFVTAHGAGSLVTGGSMTARAIVASTTAHPPEVAKAKLVEVGFLAHEGAWSAEGPPEPAQHPEEIPYVAGVAYRSDDAKPGLWLDAFVELPTQVQVLRAMYDEFRETGEIADVSFEEFVRLANATVIILSPYDLRGYIVQKTQLAAKVTL